MTALSDMRPKHAESAADLDGASIDQLDQAAIRALYGASRQLMGSTTAAAVYQIWLRAARQLSACDGVALFRLGAEPGRLLLADSAHIPLVLPVQLQVATDWEARLAQQPPGSADLQQILLAPAPDVHPMLQHARVLVVRAADQPVGLCMLIWTAEQISTGWEAALGALNADSAIALQRIEAAHAEDALPAQLLTTIHAITEIGLLYSNVHDQMLALILRQLLLMTHTESGAIFIYNDQTEQIELAVTLTEPGDKGHQRLAAKLWQPPLLTNSTEQAQQAAQQRQSVSESIGVVQQERTRPIHVISVPLMAGGWLTGVLQIAHPIEHMIDPDQLQLLQILAQQAAAAIENARLFSQIRNDQERASAVVDATNDAILMLDQRQRVMIINRRARFFFGLTERDLYGKDLHHLKVTFSGIFEHNAYFESWLHTLLRSTTERAVEEFRTLRPEQRLLQCYSAPVMDLQDRYLGRILVFRDITREREVEHMKSDFVSVVSHELRTPLTSIQGALQLVLGQQQLGKPGLGEGMPQQARHLLGISLNNAERLIRLINDILDIAKIEQGTVRLQRVALSPHELCQSVLAEMSAFARTREITLEGNLPADLPHIFADRDRATQILINLLSNAIKFSIAGQTVLLSARLEGTMVCFMVRDWGRGIAPDQQIQLFQKFQQLDSSVTRDVGGTGLGLAISKALVEEQGGRIWLESMPGQGSCFYFTLPMVRSEESSGERQHPPYALLVGPLATPRELQAQLQAAGWFVEDATYTSGYKSQHALADVVIGALPNSSAEQADFLQTLQQEQLNNGSLLLLISDVLRDYEISRVTYLPPNTGADTIVAQAKTMLAARKPHVLVVDDDPHVRPVLVRLLERYGLRVTNASDGYSGLLAAERQRPNVILLDIKMPGLDGREVLRRLKANPITETIPVIILTANDLGESLQKQVRDIGANGYLEKPIAYERLISTINGVLMPGEVRNE